MSALNVDTLANELGTGGPDFVGMPTVAGDPVVESGSNSDGEWTRFADGTQMAHQTVSSAITIDIAAVNVFRSDEALVPFSVPFVGSAPTVAGNVRSSTAVWVNARPDSTTHARVRGYSVASDPNAKIIDFFAIGRWK